MNITVISDLTTTFDSVNHPVSFIQETFLDSLQQNGIIIKKFHE
jgi:hypothetical protein